MAHGIDGDGQALFHARQFFTQPFKGGADSLIEIAPIDAAKGPVQRPGEGKAIRIVFIQQLERLEDRLGEIVQLVGIAVKIADVRPADAMAEFPLGSAALQSGPEHEGKSHCFACEGFEVDVAMIGIHALPGMPVHIEQRLKTAVVAAARLAKVKQAVYLASLPMSGQGNRLLRPKIAVATGKLIADAQVGTFHPFRHAMVDLIHAQLSLHGGHRRDAGQIDKPVVFQFTGAGFQLFYGEKHILRVKHSAPSPLGYLSV